MLMMVGMAVPMVMAVMMLVVMAMSMVMPMALRVLVLMTVGMSVAEPLLAVMALGMGESMLSTEEIRHVMIVVLMRSIQNHVEIAAIEARLCHARNADLVAIDGERRERIAKARLVPSKIEQRSDGHIAADAAGAIKIEGLAHDARPFPHSTRCKARPT